MISQSTVKNQILSSFDPSTLLAYNFLVACFATLHPAMSVRRSVGRLVGWSVGWLVGWLVGRFVGWSVVWSVGWSVGRPVRQSHFTFFINFISFSDFKSF